jgi:phosphoenolpyruvate carboxylase
MTEHCDDLLSVLMLARWGGLSDRAGNVPLDVIPLFESVHDLEVGPRLMAALLRDRIYRKHLATRDKEQTVMLGFSHSNKEGGLASSRWSMQGTHREIARIVEAENVGLTVFYGRGGTISRGGGGIRPALLAAPPGSIRGRLRSTEQGETINAKYGLPGIALRNMERSVGAIALATLRPPSVPARQDTWNAIMDEIAQSSRQAYRTMVFDDAGFEQYFRTVTPIDVIERMQLGARPGPRRGGNGIEDVRAIPWVFAWTQARFFLPGWFGIGQGLGDAIQNHGLQTVREMYQHWPFLQALVDDVEIILAKTDLNIASHYDNLTKGATPQYFENINQEYRRALDTVLQIKQIDQLLDNSMALQRSIRLRNPYVDPISLLQVDLLRQWRQGGRESDSLLDALMASINGVAEALQNTG